VGDCYHFQKWSTKHPNLEVLCRKQPLQYRQVLYCTPNKKACKWQDEHTSALKPLIYLLKRLLTSLSLTRYCYVFENCWRHSSDIRMARSFGCTCRTGDRTRLPLRAWTRMSSRCWRHYRERHFGINHRLSQRKSLTSLLEKVHLHAESHYHCA